MPVGLEGRLGDRGITGVGAPSGDVPVADDTSFFVDIRFQKKMMHSATAAPASTSFLVSRENILLGRRLSGLGRAPRAVGNDDLQDSQLPGLSGGRSSFWPGKISRGSGPMTARFDRWIKGQ